MRVVTGARMGIAADDDHALMARIAGGDRVALDALVLRHRAATEAFLARRIADHQLVEEAVQDTFLAVWQSAGSFGARSSVRTWVLAIARRQLAGKVRRRRWALAAGVTEGASSPAAEDLVLATADRPRLAAAIARLPEDQRAVVVLVLAHDRSLASAAEELGVPIGTIKSRLSRAKARLAKELEGRHL